MGNHRQGFRAITSLLLAGICCFSLIGNASSQEVAGQSSAPAAAALSDADKRQQSFEIIWTTINDRFYDPTFGGVDWKKLHERYAPLVKATNDDVSFHALMQRMISELHQSHFIIIPKESIPKILPPKEGDVDNDSESDDVDTLEEAENNNSMTALDRIRYKVTERLSTGIGIDLRILNGKAVITHVAAGSAAARAGLRPGFVISKASGRYLDDVIAGYQQNPSLDRMLRGELPLILLGSYINGERRSPVSLTYLDARSRAHRIIVTRQKLSGDMSPAVGNLPAMYTEFETRSLPHGFAYIRFNAFLPSVMKKICAALRSDQNAAGLVLDLRGNQGGLLGIIGGLAGLLNQNPVTMGIMQTRGGRTSLVSYPQRRAYLGPLVILIDGSTQSAAEMFASGLQESGRAVLIGEKTAGNTLPSAITKLPTGALFQYGFANFISAGGTVVEGQGVVPDEVVELTRRNLLAGPDPQLAAGIKQLQRFSFPKELIADVTVTTPPPPAEPKQISVATKKTNDQNSMPSDSSPRPIIVVPTAPPPPVSNAPALPTVDEVIDRYLNAIGGRAALEKLTSRVSTGTVELQSMALSGTAELYEEAPNKSTLLMNIEGIGVIQQTYDGVMAFLQDPMDGYIRFAPVVAARIRNQTAFERELHFKDLNPRLITLGRDKVNGHDVFVLVSTSPSIGEHWYFDVDSGLLLRRGNTYYDDYRTVDGVKLPFKITDDSSYGFGIVVHFNEIKHNVPIDKTKFMEYPDCFTKPDAK